MSHPPGMLTGPRIRLAILGLLAAGFAVGGFQVGRRSVDAATDRRREGVGGEGPRGHVPFHFAISGN